MTEWIIRTATGRPRTVMLVIALVTLALAAQMPRIVIDTDPENMLAVDQPDRMFHNQIEQRFALHDALVVGVVNETDEQGIYNPRSLAALHELNDRVREIDGVLTVDLMSLAEADNITQGPAGELVFEWMMSSPPVDQAAADAIRVAAERLPLMVNTLVSGDGRAAALYVPIEDKTQAYAVAREIRAVTSALDSDDDYHITGLPVAEVTFGHEMFVQMAISAPMAGAMIFLLMWFFFRSIRLIAAPMIVAIVTVVATMGLFIGLGFTVHIMSSMIPIFLMPIAVVDSVHIMSEFADAYRSGRSPRKVMSEVVRHLFRPMLFTSLTSAVGFASLLLTPIPPVRVFGAFVAFGILAAFLVTVLFIPAWVVRMPASGLEALARRGDRIAAAGDDAAHGPLAGAARALGMFGYRHGWLVVGLTAVVLVASVLGLIRIQINDNPVRWFKPSHEIRVADRVLNEHFAGTYDAFLVLERDEADRSATFATEAAGLIDSAESQGHDVEAMREALAADPAETGYHGRLIAAVDDALFDAESQETAGLEQLMSLAERADSASRYFQSPDALAAIDSLSEVLIESGLVGKTNSLSDVVKVLHRELRSGEDADYRLPDNPQAVAQLLMQYQSSHRPQDLWHMVTPDFRSTALWVQLASGDNQEMTRVISHVERHLAEHPLPEGVSARWAGKTFINVVWQSAMVRGMLLSLLGAFAAVFVMMALLFRSLRAGLIAMIPLSVTIVAIYGLIGWVGKDYDMPIAVLSSLTLGLSVDFAIHFIARFRSLAASAGSQDAAMLDMVEEPARAISRNAIVIAIGFTPLFFAPLMPYITVGAFMASVMAISGLSTLVLLPAVISTIGLVSRAR